jgi:hypothetical protein
MDKQHRTAGNHKVASGSCMQSIQQLLPEYCGLMVLGSFQHCSAAHAPNYDLAQHHYVAMLQGTGVRPPARVHQLLQDVEAALPAG